MYILYLCLRQLRGRKKILNRMAPSNPYINSHRDVSSAFRHVGMDRWWNGNASDKRNIKLVQLTVNHTQNKTLVTVLFEQQ